MKASKVKKKAATSVPKKYRYVVKVEETVLSSTAIESDKKLSWDALKGIAESRRVKGQLSLVGVTDVDSWCDEAFVNGKPSEELPE